MSDAHKKGHAATRFSEGRSSEGVLSRGMIDVALRRCAWKAF